MRISTTARDPADYTHALAGLFREKEDLKICLQRANMGTLKKVSSLSEEHSSILADQF